jgi:hypothetical protein
VLTALLVASARDGHPNPVLLLSLVVGGVKGIRLAVIERRKREGGGRSLIERVTERERYVEEKSVEPWQRAAAAIAYFGARRDAQLPLIRSQLLPGSRLTRSTESPPTKRSASSRSKPRRAPRSARARAGRSASAAGEYRRPRRDRS